MTFEEAINRDNTETGVVFSREGTFWRCYERSAYWLQQQQTLHAVKKFVKRLNSDVVFVGFPLGKWDKFVPNVPEPQAEVFVLPLQEPKDDGGFSEWRAQVSPAVDKNHLQTLQDAQRMATTAITDEHLQAILDALRLFNVESKTPMECQALVIELKRHANKIGKKEE